MLENNKNDIAGSTNIVKGKNDKLKKLLDKGFEMPSTYSKPVF